jgi:hypothetical protein
MVHPAANNSRLNKQTFNTKIIFIIAVGLIRRGFTSPQLLKKDEVLLNF